MIDSIINILKGFKSKYAVLIIFSMQAIMSMNEYDHFTLDRSELLDVRILTEF